MFTRILIANRGEIAVRVARACREAGIRSVAVYSEPDAGALHVRHADEALPLGGSDPSESYLSIEKIVKAAQKAGCEAVHPGYGFLSENARFAGAVESAGLVFIGPSPDALRLMGDKTRARALMREAGIPVVPGSEQAGRKGAFAREAARIGYPVLVKAAGGGGGRGMRVVASADGLEEAVESARREAAGAFGDDRLFLEKFVAGARHVEFQILGDTQGNVVHLFERDCSIQRRHQKVIEETPSPVLTEELRGRMGGAAVLAGRAAGYRNAGTVEFLLDPATGETYFLEMNTRLQVEHPITECLTGIDLVAAQIRIAAGEPLSRVAPDPKPRGHALECRLYAEDPAAEFRPSPGRVMRFVAPGGPGVRVDSGYESGDEIPMQYDPMIAKIVVSAESREAAIRRMERALAETVVLGVTTNLPFLRDVLAHPVFLRGEADTGFLSRHFAGWAPPEGSLPDEVLIAAALAGTAETAGAGGPAAGPDLHSPWESADGFRIGR